MSNEFFALDSEGGEPLWYLQILMTIKASGDKTGGALGLLDFKTPAGQTPLHVHHKEDEGWYLLEGKVTCTCGDESTSIEPDRKSTRLNSSHLGISYAVFCLK